MSLQKNAEKNWKKINSNKDEHLTFDELIENTIGGIETCIDYFRFIHFKAIFSNKINTISGSDEEKETRKDDYKTYLKLMERNKKR